MAFMDARGAYEHDRIAEVGGGEYRCSRKYSVQM